MDKWQLAQKDIRYGLYPEEKFDWKNLIFNVITLICLILSALLIIERENLDDAKIYVNSKLQEYDNLDKTWIHCLNGGRVDIGDGWHLDCSKAPQVKVSGTIK